MNVFGRNRFTNWLIIILVLLNLGLLATFWYSRLNPPQEKTGVIEDTGRQPGLRGRPAAEHRQKQAGQLARFLEKELNFTQQQVQQFLKLREEHFQKADQLRKKMDDLRKEMMDHLLDPLPDTDKAEQLAAALGQTMAELEKTMFRHMLELMNIGDTQQREKYRMLLREILNRLRPPDHGPPPGKQPRGRPEDQVEGSPEDRERPPQRGPGQEGGRTAGYLNRLRSQLQLIPEQVEKIRPIVTAALQKLESIPSDPTYRDHRERREAAERIHRQMDSQIEALLTEEQKWRYTQMKSQYDRHPPRPPH
jgi:Spy/CpxP family protein refolding chaperone